MGNRSNINLVGNTTQGQNVGIGCDVYKGKDVGNLLQYKTLSVTGTTMIITSDADNIYFSANTGGGGSSLWTQDGTCIRPATANDDVLIDNQAELCWDAGASIQSISGATNNGFSIDTNTGAEFGVAANEIWSLIGNSFYLKDVADTYHMCITPTGTIDSQCNNITIKAATINSSSQGFAAHLCAGSNNGTGAGGDVCVCAGSATSNAAGDICICAGTSSTSAGGNVYIHSGAGTAGNPPIYLDAGSSSSSSIVALGSPTTSAGVTSRNVIACGLASNINMLFSTKGTGIAAFLTTKFSVGNTNNAGFTLDCGTSSFCLPKNIKICGANGIANASCCDGWNIDMMGGFGSTNTGYAGSGGTVCICGGCAKLGSGGSGAKDGGSVVFHSGPGINGGVEGRIILDNLPAKSSETCGLWIDASGNLSTGFISGSTGNSVWSQNGGFVHPDTATDSVIISDSECYAWSGGSYIYSNLGDIILSSDYPTTGGGRDICLKAGWSNDAQGGDIHIQSGFAYSPGGGGDIYITPEIGQASTGRLYLKNLVDCVSETCVLYTDANGRISKGPAALTVYDFSSGICEFGTDTVCLGGAMSGTTTLCLNQNSAQQFLICDCSTTPLVIAMCRHYTSNPAILIGQSLLGNKIVISPSHTDPIQIGGVDVTGCAGIRVGGNCIRMQSYETCGACVAVTHAGCAIIQGCCGNTTHHGCDALICGGGTTSTSGSYHGGHVHICGGAHGGTNGGNIYMCVVDSGDTVMVGLPSQDTETCVLYIASDGTLATGTPSSDCRLKCCVEPITCATSMLDNICGYSAEFNNLSNCEGRCEYVMMAQEVEPYLPLAVKNGVIINDVDYKKIEYDQLVPVLWNIVKEQELRIKLLEDKA